MDQFSSIVDWVIANLGTTAVAAAIVVEFLFRIFPTNKAWSLLLVVKALCAKLASAFQVLNDWLDKVIPQSLKK